MKLTYLIILLLCTPMLSACNTNGCLKAEDAYSEEVVDVVPTKPDGLNNFNPLSYWVKSSLKIDKQIEQVLSIRPLDVDFCATNSTAIALLAPTKHSPININNITFNRNDTVQIVLSPIEQIPLNQEICNGELSVVQVRDRTACEKAAETGVAQIIEISDPFSDEYPNMIYPESIKTKWVKSPKVAFPQINDYKDNRPENFCDGSLENNIWENRYVNEICGNICHLNKQNGFAVTENCAFVKTNELVISPREISTGQIDTSPQFYLPGVKAYLHNYVDQSKIQPMGEYRGGVSKGVLLNHPNEVTMDKARLIIGFHPEFRNFKGGYKVSVVKSCSNHTKNALYAFVGKSPPEIKPGEVGSTLIPIDEKVSKFYLDTSGGGSVYYGVADNGDGYDNNTGVFEVKTKVPLEIKATFSYVIKFVIDSIQRILYGETDKDLVGKTDVNGAVGGIYKGIIHGKILGLIRVVIALYITVYLILYIMGLIKSPRMEIVIGIIKISIILMLLSPESWSFFNKYLFSLFIHGTGELIKIMAGSIGENEFEFVDKTIGRLAKSQTWMQLLSLLFAGPAGWLALFAIFSGLWGLVISLVEASVMYLISIVMIALLLSISPLFIILILFKKPKLSSIAGLKL